MVVDSKHSVQTIWQAESTPHTRGSAGEAQHGHGSNEGGVLSVYPWGLRRGTRRLLYLCDEDTGNAVVSSSTKEIEGETIASDRANSAS